MKEWDRAGIDLVTPGYGRKSIKHKYVQMGSDVDFPLFSLRQKRAKIQIMVVHSDQGLHYVPAKLPESSILMRIKSYINH